jgi:hypothetical protein
MNLSFRALVLATTLTGGVYFYAHSPDSRKESASGMEIFAHRISLNTPALERGFADPTNSLPNIRRLPTGYSFKTFPKTIFQL